LTPDGSDDSVGSATTESVRMQCVSCEEPIRDGDDVRCAECSDVRCCECDESVVDNNDPNALYRPVYCARCHRSKDQQQDKQVGALNAIRLLATGRSGVEWDEVRAQLKGAGISVHAQPPEESIARQVPSRVETTPTNTVVATFINSNAGVASVTELARIIGATEGMVRAWARAHPENVRRIGSTFCFTLKSAGQLLRDFSERSDDDPEELEQ